MTDYITLAYPDGDTWVSGYTSDPFNPKEMVDFLKKHYRCFSKFKKLVHLGWISYVGEEIGSKHSLNSKMNEKRKWCTSFLRDEENGKIEEGLGEILECNTQDEELPEFYEESQYSKLCNKRHPDLRSMVYNNFDRWLIIYDGKNVHIGDAYYLKTRMGNSLNRNITLADFEIL